MAVCVTTEPAETVAVLLILSDATIITLAGSELCDAPSSGPRFVLVQFAALEVALHRSGPHFVLAWSSLCSDPILISPMPFSRYGVPVLAFQQFVGPILFHRTILICIPF